MKELKWKWAYFPWLDAPEKQREGAINAGYAKVVLKSEADKVIAELEQRLEDAKATAYAESVDAGMRERRLRRSLWLARLRSLMNFSVLSYFQTLRATTDEDFRT